MDGRLMKYGPESPHVAFVSGAHRKHLIFIGGLTDGLFGCRYLESLAETADRLGYSLVQAMTSSSHEGFGVGSLKRDAGEIQMLMRVLRSSFESEVLFFCFHSGDCALFFAA